MKVAVIYNKHEIHDTDVINVFGMPTKERYNPKTVEKVASALEKGGHNVRIIEGNMRVIDNLQNFMPRVMSGERAGMVFNMAYGIQGQSRYTHIPAMLEMLGIPYVGSSPAGHAIALDKVMSKIVFLRHGVSTPAFWMFSNADEDCSNVVYPVIVKPKMEAVSFGLRIVDNEDDLREAISFIVAEFEQDALVEAFIPGREFAVGLLGNGAGLETLPIVEIDLEGDPNAIQTVDDKMQAPRQKICPAQISPEMTNSVRQLAKDAFTALGLFDFARVDMRMDNDGNLYILEINSMASLGLTGSYVHAAQVAGYDYSALVNRMLEVAAIRYFGASYHQTMEKTTSPAPQKGIPLHVRVRSYLRSQLQTIEDYLERIVSINTYVYNIESVNALGNWFSTRFQQLGFHRQVHPQTEVGNVLYFSNHTEEQNDILILGHLDTRYEYQNYVPFQEERGRIYGSGVTESKGGLAVILGALQALRFARMMKKVKCGVLLTTDDSLGGRFSKKVINEYALNSKYVVNTKYGDEKGGIVTSCAGTRQYQIELTNIKSSKAHDIPDVVTNVCQKVIAWQKLSSLGEGIKISILSLNAQTVMGRNSDHATVTLLIQFNEQGQSAELDKQIKVIAEKGANGNLQVQVKRGARRLPVTENNLNRAFFENISSLAEKLEVRVEAIHRQTSSDICHIPETIPVLDGFGPVGGNFESPNEYILRDSLIDRAALLAMTIHHAMKSE